MSNDWIPIADAKINNDKRYEVTYETGNVAVRCGKVIAEVVGNIIAIREYNPTPYVAPTPIDPGEGWRRAREKIKLEIVRAEKNAIDYEGKKIIMGMTYSCGVAVGLQQALLILDFYIKDTSERIE